MNLYEITGEFRAISQMLDGAEGDAIMLEAVGQALADNKADFDDKCRAVVHIIANYKGNADALDAEISRLSARKKAADNRKKWLEDYLLTNMLATGTTEISHPAFTIKLQDNPPSVVVDDAALIPMEFMRQKPAPAPEPDKSAIKDAFKSGNPVPGCRVESKQRLVIK